MSVLVLDTNVVSFFLKNHALASLYRPHLQGHTLAISFMTVGELYEGAFRANWGKQKWQHLNAILRRYVVIPSSWQVCEHWAKIRAERVNRPISVDDAWIAASARAHSCNLLTHNPADYYGISDLIVITEHSFSSD